MHVVEANSNFSLFQNGITLLHKSAYDKAGALVSLISLAVGSIFFFPSAAVPFFVTAGTLYITKVVVKINSREMKLMTDKATSLDNNRSYLKFICIAASIAFTFLSPTLSLVAAAGSGIYVGFIIEKKKIIRRPKTIPTDLTGV
jgi:hypothetical protein